ncbi:MAG: TraM recognition domain-containing protein [Lachnospiraceae bacterium]|nr:TraM recognition domain-containing protein [Lachnospiraceae bacterium]
MTGCIAIIVIGVMLCPVSLVMIIITAVINRIRGSTHGIGELFSGMIGAVIFLIGYLSDQPLFPPVITYVWNMIVNSQHPIPSDLLRSWLTSSLPAAGITIIIEQICIFLTSLTPERMMLAEDRRQEKRKLQYHKIDHVPKRSQIIFGVSGAGKSAFIGKSLEEIILRDKEAVIYVIDGKGSTERYSLYYSAKLIAKKHHIPLTLINGTSNRKLGGIVYDFLEGVESTDAMKDMIMALIGDPLIKASAGSEHYRTMTERYLIEEIECMKRYGIDVTLFNVLTLLEPDQLVQQLSLSGAPPDEISVVQQFAASVWPEVRDNAEKLRMFLKGEGAEIFSGDGEHNNLRKAYEKGGIVLILADEMSRPKLSGRLVQIITMDLRNLVAARLTGTMDMHKRIYVFYDEFSSYVSSIPLIRSIYAKCRSSETVMTLATQSCADIIGLDPSWFDILCNTADRFIVFRQHASSAESAAGIFGTEAHVTQTSRSSDLETTGESSNTSDRTYVISPDIIRNLPVNVGIMLDKTEKSGRQVKCFKNKFLKGG